MSHHEPADLQQQAAVKYVQLFVCLYDCVTTCVCTHPNMYTIKTGKSSGAKAGSGSYNPQSLLSAVCCHAPVFKGKQQHDAHELVRVLLDGLQVSPPVSVVGWLGVGDCVGGCWCGV